MTTRTELEIVSPGAFASIQDGGRHGHRRIGVPWAGVLDRRLMRIANALAGREMQGACPVPWPQLGRGARGVEPRSR